jgi:hypothetical protein
MTPTTARLWCAEFGGHLGWTHREVDRGAPPKVPVQHPLCGRQGPQSGPNCKGKIQMPFLSINNGGNGSYLRYMASEDAWLLNKGKVKLEEVIIAHQSVKAGWGLMREGSAPDWQWDSPLGVPGPSQAPTTSVGSAFGSTRSRSAQRSGVQPPPVRLSASTGSLSRFGMRRILIRRWSRLSNTLAARRRKSAKATRGYQSFISSSGSLAQLFPGIRSDRSQIVSLPRRSMTICAFD